MCPQRGSAIIGERESARHLRPKARQEPVDPPMQVVDDLITVRFVHQFVARSGVHLDPLIHRGHRLDRLNGGFERDERIGIAVKDRNGNRDPVQLHLEVIECGDLRDKQLAFVGAVVDERIVRIISTYRSVA